VFTRGLFILIALFWAAMNVMLWRAEYGAHGSAGSFVPVEVVWKKILTAPDNSPLSILQDGKRIGFCQWVTGVDEALAELDDAPPEGMPNKAGNYRIGLSGDVSIAEVVRHLRFDCSLVLSANQSWQELKLHLGARPASWEIHSVAAEQTVRIKTDDGESRFERVFRLSDLQNPGALAPNYAGPFAYALLGGLELPAATQSPRSIARGIKWEARRDTLKIGHEPVGVYRLQTRMLDRYSIVIFVSRVGEILRVELPNRIVLMHDQLINL